jgi:hypothetical protein
MANTLVQTKTQTTSFGTSTTTITPTTATVVSDLVVVNLVTVSAVTGLTVTDNATVPNVYTLAAGPIAVGDGRTLYQFWGTQFFAATTITLSWTNSVVWQLVVEEFAGPGVLDQVASNSGTATSSSVTLSPTNSGELVVAGVVATSGTSFVPGAGYTSAATQTPLTSEYNLSATTSETVPLSWTTSSVWAEIATAFLPGHLRAIVTADQSILYGDSVSMTVTPSNPNHESLTYAWSITSAPSGSTAALTGSTTATASLKPNKLGSYTVQCIVSASGGDTATVTTHVLIPKAQMWSRVAGTAMPSRRRIRKNGVTA